MTVVFGHVYEMGDGINHVIEIFIDLMLPEPEDDPSFFDIVSCDVGVPLDVATDFLTPELGIRLRKFEVKGAAMPIARVQENDDTESRKRDVRCSIQLPIVPVSYTHLTLPTTPYV